MQSDEDNFEDYPLAYSIDNAILMHRDAHFGGDFATMLEYYQKGRKGISQEFDIERIKSLDAMEQKTEKNLSALFLSGPEAEKVARSKQAYKDLRAIYEASKDKLSHPRLIADLILAEAEEETAAINAIVAQKGAIVPLLIDLLRNEEFYDPLYPGYGHAPELAATCLGKIGDKRAIISLFEAIGAGDFFNEDMILKALHAIGQPAKEFLLKVLHGHPLTNDNERAAIALLNFKEDPEVSSVCLKMLQEIDLKQHASLATYLALICEGLIDKQERETLLQIAKKPDTPKLLRQDIEAVSKLWS